MSLFDDTASKTLATAIVGAVVGGWKLAWGRLRRKKESAVPTASTGDVSEPTPTPALTGVTGVAPKVGQERFLVIGGERVRNLHHAHKAYMAAPFLQREDVAKHYIGLTMGAVGELHSLEPWVGKLLLQIATPGHVSAFAYLGEIAEYPALALLSQGAEIMIVGKVESISQHGVMLTDFQLWLDGG